MIPLFQLPGVLRRQLFPIAIQHDQDRKPETGGIAVPFHHVGVVTLVHVDQDDDVMFLNYPGNRRVCFEQTAQLMAPSSPVGPKLQEDALVLGLCRLEGGCDLLLPIRARIVELWPFRFLKRFSGDGKAELSRADDNRQNQNEHCGLGLVSHAVRVPVDGTPVNAI